MIEDLECKLYEDCSPLTQKAEHEAMGVNYSKAGLDKFQEKTQLQEQQCNETSYPGNPTNGDFEKKMYQHLSGAVLDENPASAERVGCLWVP